jgi:hypothetical protein
MQSNIPDTTLRKNADGTYSLRVTLDAADINVDSSSVDTSGMIGKPSGGDFTTAYLAATTITLGTYPDGTSVTADDIVAVVQIATGGTVTATYTRDDAGMSIAANVLTVAGATFAASDIFVVYTNVPRALSLGTLIEGEDQTNHVMKTEQQFVYTNITSATTTVVKSGAGFLHAVAINLAVAAGVITLYDNTAGSGTKIATITFPTPLLANQMLMVYNVKFTTGLTIVTSASTDLTISTRA